MLAGWPGSHRDASRQWEECCLGTLRLLVRWGLTAGNTEGPHPSYLISQQCFAELQVVSFQDGGPMELSQWVLGSEWERKRERHMQRENQHARAKKEVKHLIQSRLLLILQTKRLMARNEKELVTQEDSGEQD